MSRVIALIWKDLLIEARSRQFIGAMLAFTLIVIVTLNFAFDLIREGREMNGAGALWVAILFSGLIGIGRSIAVERDRGTLDGLILTPIDGGTLFLGKFGASLASIIVVEIVALPVFAALYDLPALDPLVLGIVLAGSAGLAGLGTLFSAVTSGGRSREVLLPLLLFPLMIPVLIAAVRATGEVFQGDRDDILRWINLLIGFDAIFIVLAYLGFGFLIED
ncbi:MAG TPA: heme exporter protein CcmB [Thermomicrobiales bacterium]|nr:heme exporter protein CcmB [Thermomicrobiales bacterium]